MHRMPKRKCYSVNSREANGGPHEMQRDAHHNEASGNGPIPAPSALKHTQQNDLDSVMNTDATMMLDEDILCGFICLKPTCIQPLRSMILFTLLYGLTILFALALVMYVVSQITTIEKQLGISSAETGVLLAANDVGFLATVLFWSHFARKANRPVIIAVTAMIFGLAAIICALPNFTLTMESSPTAGHSLICSSEIMPVSINMTSPNETTWPDKITESPPQTDSSGAYHTAYIVIAAGMALQGIAKAPRRPVGLTYMDDNLPKDKLGIYVGFTIAMIFVGPIVGSVLGAVFSQMHVTLEDTSMTLADPRWIGAWWLGFMVIGGLTLVAGIPLLFFPKRMPNTEKFSDNQTNHKEETAKSLVSDFPKSAFRLTKNPVYVLLILSEGLGMFMASGATSFFPKYIEQHFIVATWKAGILMGAAIAVAGILGSLVSGFITSRLKLTLLGSMVVIFVADVTVCVCTFLYLAATCPQPMFHGLINPSPGIRPLAAENNNLTCSGGCTPGCSESMFLPTCGADGITYFSPCHAGCTGVLPNMTFFGCSCVSDDDAAMAMPGFCEGECEMLPVFLVLFAIMIFTTFVASVPQAVNKLRCVKEKDRRLALGFNGFFSSLLGFLIGPIVFGAVIDSTCILWQGVPGSSTGGYCTLYDTGAFRRGMFTLMGGVMAGVCLLDTIILVIVIFAPRYKKIIQEQRVQYIVAEENLHEKKVEKDVELSPHRIENGATSLVQEASMPTTQITLQDKLTEALPEDVPENVPDDVSQDVSEYVPEYLPEDVYQDVSEDVPEYLLNEYLTRDVPEDVSENGSLDSLDEEMKCDEPITSVDGLGKELNKIVKALDTSDDENSSTEIGHTIGNIF